MLPLPVKEHETPGEVIALSDATEKPDSFTLKLHSLLNPGLLNPQKEVKSGEMAYLRSGQHFLSST